MKTFEVEYLTVDYKRLTTKVNALNADEAELMAFDNTYESLCSNDWWRELIDIIEVPFEPEEQ